MEIYKFIKLFNKTMKLCESIVLCYPYSTCYNKI